MSKTRNPRKPNSETNPKLTNLNKTPQISHKQKLPSWAFMRSILTCKHIETEQQNPKINQKTPQIDGKISKKSKKISCSGSICSNTKVIQRPDPISPEIAQRKNRGKARNPNNSAMKDPILREISNGNRNRVLGKACSAKGKPFRKLSGCYECRMVVDPVLGFTRDSSLRSTICSCPHCGLVFMNPDNLEVHQSVRHAVSKLGPEDTSKNIVEIIFQSSWLVKQTPVCQIDRILKVQNTQKTINKFEEYRDFIKFKATKLPKKHPRCIADGNELLRFHCTTFRCSLGLNGASNLCHSIPNCLVCNVIKNGFKSSGPTQKGVLTTATSGRAHDLAEVDGERRAMLVCRVIAGRVKKVPEGGVTEEYDSVAGVYGNLDELYVFNHKAILPCFVVIYRGV